MALAWDINSIKSGDFGRFFSTMAESEFGQELSEDIGAAGTSMIVSWHCANMNTSGPTPSLS
jgi:hypothetical protein